MKFYLSVKRVQFEVILALELVGVGLTHDQAVLVASEDVRLVHDLKTTPGEVSFSSNYNNSLPFPTNTKPCCLLLVGIFSVTRRSRSDAVHLLPVSWLADLTDVTLVNDDT